MKEMKDKYSVFVDNEKIAEHMSIEGALVQLLCEKKHEVMTISIVREPAEEEKE